MSLFFKKEVFFVKFPFLFPLIYLGIFYFLPKFETYLIFFTILILAESHFGATWPFFLNKINFPHIKEKKISLILVPVLLIMFCLIGFFYFKNLFLLVFFSANVFHVTRQSYGVMSLYTKNFEEKKHYSNIIYIFNFIFFVIAFFRFYIPLIKDEHLILLNCSIILVLICLLLYELKKFKFSENFLTLITGTLIFYPVCFVSNPVHAIIMGVTMHYSQYLFLTSKVIQNRINQKDYKKKNSIYRFWIIIFFYSAIMSILLLFVKNDLQILNNLIVIPITGQMLHFYLDSQLWKFSEKHNRENILDHLQELK